ncbi:mannitol-1-phosphate 5-dehydrogenase [Paenibacillus sp.]|uniref:mannitol-1-phosphate 5-dehydrogenase n=1 Tax=Paenibacillus sp. TaxID=58172 RepID=UPI002D68E2B6|nr:mannitol-1-phosphate 5-dehydrogenase [Paenibacillus sp.]HZG86449.1 mannitol-1-phosphate 5-dehydrogenase [Paenibacillus sp.]
MNAVHFGAGNIGRGFIGLMLAKAGYNVVFVDVNDALVKLLQERGSYEVALANGSGDTIRVEGVDAIDGKRTDDVAAAVAKADLVTTAVGVNILKLIADGIARGIERRLAAGVAAPLHVIACENAIRGSEQLKEHVYARLSPETRAAAEGRVAFPNAAVDRIVPLQKHDDPLRVTVEPFAEWVVDRSAMLPGGPLDIEGVHYVDELQPYIERKLFTVNTGHCCAAYHGYLLGHDTIQAAMADERVKSEVVAILEETGAMLVAKYGFDEEEHRRYRETILERFANPYLTDEVARVGRSPIRKLSPNDRLVRPATLAHELGIAVPHLAAAMGAALRFDAADDPEAAELQQALQDLGVHGALEKYTGLPKGHPIHDQAAAAYERHASTAAEPKGALRP